MRDIRDKSIIIVNGETSMHRLALLASLLVFSTTTEAVEKIVSWNVSPTFYEGLELRKHDFQQLNEQLRPDILILVEVSGAIEAQMIADQLGWDDYYLAVSDWSIARTNAYFSLEAAVISKVPITNVVEYDTQPESVVPVIHNGELTQIPVTEKKLSSAGIPHFGDTLAQTDRGTMRVDLANGLSIFPVHLKSNRNNACFDLRDIIRNLEKYGFPVSPALRESYERGFAAATDAHLNNARKRERVIASVARVAGIAFEDGLIPVIAGDFNTAFESGKYGIDPSDCELAEFSCAKGPFPKQACSNGDGFDDTLGILEKGLTSKITWQFVSRDFPRTYDDSAYANLAIDHIAVPEDTRDHFTAPGVGDKTFGSDHYPLMVNFQNKL